MSHLQQNLTANCCYFTVRHWRTSRSQDTTSVCMFDFVQPNWSVQFHYNNLQFARSHCGHYSYGFNTKTQQFQFNLMNIQIWCIFTISTPILAKQTALIINSVCGKCWWVQKYEGDWEVRTCSINVCLRWNCTHWINSKRIKYITTVNKINVTALVMEVNDAHDCVLYIFVSFKDFFLSSIKSCRRKGSLIMNKHLQAWITIDKTIVSKHACQPMKIPLEAWKLDWLLKSTAFLTFRKHVFTSTNMIKSNFHFILIHFKTWTWNVFTNCKRAAAKTTHIMSSVQVSCWNVRWSVWVMAMMICTWSLPGSHAELLSPDWERNKTVNMHITLQK